jgi:hypothetical protein
MEPVITVSTGLTIAKTAGEIGKRLFQFGKSLTDREAKQLIDGILDELRDLKQSASELEDENRDLREKLRFKSDDFEFRNPFWYEKVHPDRALCAKCFAKRTVGPMGNLGQGCDSAYRRCLVCEDYVQIRPSRLPQVITEHSEWG